MSAAFATNGVVRLAHWGLMRARGADAASFLHGQFTSDVLHLGAERAVLAGYCSAKGRLQASFVVWRAAADELLLACAADLLAPTLKRLSMFVLRAQCKLGDASAELPLYGLAGEAAAARLGDAPVWSRRDTPEGTLIRLPDAAGVPRALLAAADAPAGLPALALETWRWLEVGSGVPLIEVATVEQFVPQMVNLELVGGVDFRKGCYPGQEVVARSQYRGTLKRRMFLFDVAAPAQAGQEIFHSGDPGQPAGLVANAAPAPQGGSRLLAEVKLAALAGGSLHLGAPDGPLLQRQALPYDVPLESAATA
ncbi:YgfZ/GcvT domain-containing protein [Piscinibacter sp.]|uniref:CAF17-like 4Fe-4S cluster assembly/insertion protein YgfZ n=1 Tax=Piscinibacter sp. TaxID=1903157 RepID=UPI0039E496E6